MLVFKFVNLSDMGGVLKETCQLFLVFKLFNQSRTQKKLGPGENNFLAKLQ